MRRIAIEEAFVTEAIAEQWQKVIADPNANEPGFKKMAEALLCDSPPARLLHEQLADLGTGRIRAMDEAGIDIQILSITSPGVQVFQAELATELARDANEQLAQAVKNHPDRFAGLAAVAPQQPEAAAMEIERAAGSLGMRGVIINSHTGGEYLDDRKYRPMLEAAEATGFPIYLHPRTPSHKIIDPFLDFGLYFAGWGFAADTGLHAMRLIMSGVFDRFPKLKIILGHMGEGIPFWLDRIDNRYLLQVKLGAVEAMKRLPSDYFRENFVITTSGMPFEAPFMLACQTLGAERILFAADYPYESMGEAVAFMDAAAIPEEDLHLIYHGNAEKMFEIPAGRPLF